MELSVIVDAERESRVWLTSAQGLAEAVAAYRKRSQRITVAALEVPLPVLVAKRETHDAAIGQFSALAESVGLRDLPIYAELPREAGRDDRFLELLPGAMAALARHGLGAKIRCGGLTADAIPNVSLVRAFIAGATAAGVPFKATAGLHHPVRHLDVATGFVMHGFLNLLAAAVFAPLLDAHDLEAILDDESPAAFGFSERSFAWRNREATLDEIAVARASRLAGYGSCSFEEPVADLTALGILPS
jgi:hypothetical protein